jgi:hypothetical protein
VTIATVSSTDPSSSRIQSCRWVGLGRMLPQQFAHVTARSVSRRHDVYPHGTIGRRTFILSTAGGSTSGSKRCPPRAWRGKTHCDGEFGNDLAEIRALPSAASGASVTFVPHRRSVPI